MGLELYISHQKNWNKSVKFYRRIQKHVFYIYNENGEDHNSYAMIILSKTPNKENDYGKNTNFWT